MVMADHWWVLVCDASRARVFATSTPGARMDELESWVNPPGRMSDRELGDDRPGRGMDRARGSRHAMDPPVDPHEKAQTAFAHLLAHRLARAWQEKHFNRLALIAPAAMLGRLRAALDRHCTEAAVLQWARDLSGLSAMEIAMHLARERPVGDLHPERPGPTSVLSGRRL